MPVKLRTVSGVEIYLNPNQVSLVMPHPQILGQSFAFFVGGTESFNLSSHELAEKLWPGIETKSLLSI